MLKTKLDFDMAEILPRTTATIAAALQKELSAMPRKQRIREVRELDKEARALVRIHCPEFYADAFPVGEELANRGRLEQHRHPRG